jgi:hypothetical protein
MELSGRDRLVQRLFRQLDVSEAPIYTVEGGIATEVERNPAGAAFPQ